MSHWTRRKHVFVTWEKPRKYFIKHAFDYVVDDTKVNIRTVSQDSWSSADRNISIINVKTSSVQALEPVCRWRSSSHAQQNTPNSSLTSSLWRPAQHSGLIDHQLTIKESGVRTQTPARMEMSLHVQRCVPHASGERLISPENDTQHWVWLSRLTSRA